MQCTWCGTEIPDDSAFCESCGKPLSKDDAVAPTSTSSALTDWVRMVEADSAGSADSATEEEADGKRPAHEGRHVAFRSDDEDVADEPARTEAPRATWDDATGADEGPLEEFTAIPDGDFASSTDYIDSIEPIDVLEDELLVDYPSGPEQPRLGKARIAIIAVIATLFGAAMVLLFCVVLMRVLGI